MLRENSFTYKNTKMNTTAVKGNWNEQKGRLKQKFAMLTDNDLMFAEGKKEEMYGRLQVKLGKSKEELQKIIAEL
ncbi:MAG: csbd family protein [Bacteroidetes bacterium]|nr:MAG: csbd family protein [Bacteroidota bacterium]